MAGTYIDDRTQDERVNVLTYMVGGIDRTLSGWGGAEGGRSFAFWACRPEDAEKLWDWIDQRSDLRYVRSYGATCAVRLRARDHCHVYAVRDGHPALN